MFITFIVRNFSQ